MNQLELFAEPVAEIRTVPTAESVRIRLEAMLQRLQAGGDAASARDIARWRLIVPQMADWLPPEEGAAVRAEFASLVGEG